jgi:hypothetical protein
MYIHTYIHTYQVSLGEENLPGFGDASLHAPYPGVLFHLRFEEHCGFLMPHRVVEHYYIAYLQPLWTGEVQRGSLPARPYVVRDGQRI